MSENIPTYILVDDEKDYVGSSLLKIILIYVVIFLLGVIMGMMIGLCII